MFKVKPPSVYELIADQRKTKIRVPFKLTWQQIFTLIICFVVDILDYVGLAIPYVGDVADAFLVLLLTRYFGKDAWIATFIQSFEMLPGADILPLSIIAALIVIHGEYIRKTKTKIK